VDADADIKVNCIRSRPLMALGWVQRELLNRLLTRFLAAVTHAEVTTEIVMRELSMFRVHEMDHWFRDLYSAIEREHTQEMLLGAVRQRDLSPNNPNKKLKLNEDKGGEPKRVVYCHAFLSVAGCVKGKPACRFPHKSAGAATAAEKEKLKKVLQAKGMVPNPDKF
jgi:hypothetical protein